MACVEGRETRKSEKYLYMRFSRSLGTTQEFKMKRQYRLIRLRTETVEDLKRLMLQMGATGLDELVAKMVHVTDAYRLGIKEMGWYSTENR